MKLRIAKKVHYDAGVNMTPLVDVVMVLLIFLMIAGKFTGQEKYLLSTTPMRQSGIGSATPPPGGFPKDEPLEIQVDSPTPDRFRARVGQYHADSGDELLVVLKNMREQLLTAGRKKEDLQIVISPGRAVKYKFLIDVYTASNRAGFERIGFSTSR